MLFLVAETGIPINSKIYIRTKFAWYILDTPSTAYAPFFIPLLRQHQILHFVISLSLEEPDIDYDGFIECLEDAKCYEDLLPKTFHVLGSIFQADDVESDDVVRDFPNRYLPRRDSSKFRTRKPICCLHSPD